MKKKIVLGLAMAAMAVFTLSGCQDDSTTNPIVNAENGNNSGNGNQTGTTSGNITSGTDNQSGTGATNVGNENQSGTGVTTGGNENQSGTGGNTTGGEGTQTNTGGNNSQQQENLPTPVITNTTDGVQVLKCAGDQESLYAEFSPVTNADNYNVYVKGGQYNDFTKIDGQLVRLYKDGNNYYHRADAVGLKKGTYELKIVPVISGSEVSSKQGTVSDIAVVSYDRTGFAFSSVAGKNGAAPGAYNNDGTLKSNAHVIYLTNSNKSTVKATVAGTEYTGIAEITGAIKTKKTTEPYDIRVIGKVDYEGTVCSDLSGWYAMGCKEGSNITVEGIGNDATMYGGGVGFNKCTSVEVRNLGFIEWGKGNSDSDAVQFQGTEHVWVHDNDIFYGHKASGDQAKGDGSVDLKDNTKYMTVSYNHFWDSGKMSLCGMKSESGENYISYHHNWFDHSDSRHPRIRTMTVHVYNNYYDGVSKYGVGAVLSSQCFAEGNYFRNCKDPFLVGGYGTDGAASKSTFSGETKGFIKAYNNHIEGATALMYANAAAGVAGSTKAGTKDNSDAYLASTRDEVISNEYTNGVAYSNFDTKVDLGVTASQVESPENAKATVMKYAGRVAGGDFTYTFDNSTADTSYEIDNNLSALLIAYTSKLVSVQEIGTQTQGGSQSGTEGGNENTGGESGATTPVTGTQSIYFNGSKVNQTGAFTANVSSYKKASDLGGTGLSLDGTTYDVAAKFDSSASISFTLSSSAKITIYMACKASGNKLNVGSSKIETTATGITKYELNLNAGSYTINKNSGELYIFLIVIE